MFDPVLVHEFLTRSARRHPDKEALVCHDQRVSYRELDRRTDILSRSLRTLGVDFQDRVCVFMDNCTEIVVSVFGVLKARGVFSVLNGSMKPPKLAYVLKNSDAKVLVAPVDRAEVVQKALDEAQTDCRVIWVGDSSRIPRDLADRSHEWDSLVAGESSGDGPQVDGPRCLDVDLATLIYTSGSTGDPKGVMSTHGNMVAAARSIIQYIGNREDDVVLNVLPLSFDYGLYQVIMSVMFGGTVVLERSFLYLHQILSRLETENVTGFPIVPSIVAMILKMNEPDKYALDSVRYLTNTGAALPVQHIAGLENLFPGARIFSMYGLTECKRVSYLPPEQLRERPSSVGIPMPNCDVSILDADDNPVGPDEVGELVIRGANVMQGYWKDPERTAAAYRPGRYPGERRLYSGDLFRQDADGYLYFVGRRDEMIKTRGERVGTKEVEDVLCSMSEVVEAAIIGVPDDVLGQAIKAFVVPASGCDVAERDVRRHCNENLESFMVPKYVEFLDRLPRSAHGKIDRKSLASR